MCHQSVGLIARHLEAAGIPTIGLTSARSITARTNPPRAVFVDAPLGHTSGPPGDSEMQLHIVRSALGAAAAMTAPGTIHDLDLRWHHDRWRAEPLSWSRSRDADTSPDAGDARPPRDTRGRRDPNPVYQSASDRVAAAAVDPDAQRRVCLGIDVSPEA